MPQGPLQTAQLIWLQSASMVQSLVTVQQQQQQQQQQQAPFVFNPFQPNDVLCQVALDIPSIKATLSDREFQLIQSMAGDNFGEQQRLPDGALWLEDAYADHELADDEKAKCVLALLLVFSSAVTA